MSVVSWIATIGSVNFPPGRTPRIFTIRIMDRSLYIRKEFTLLCEGKSDVNHKNWQLHSFYSGSEKPLECPSYPHGTLWLRQSTRDQPLSISLSIVWLPENAYTNYGMYRECSSTSGKEKSFTRKYLFLVTRKISKCKWEANDRSRSFYEIINIWTERWAPDVAARAARCPVFLFEDYPVENPSVSCRSVG